MRVRETRVRGNPSALRARIGVEKGPSVFRPLCGRAGRFDPGGRVFFALPGIRSASMSLFLSLVLRYLSGPTCPLVSLPRGGNADSPSFAAGGRSPPGGSGPLDGRSPAGGGLGAVCPASRGRFDRWHSCIPCS